MMTDEKKVLLIVAAGKSLRFGGSPKAFASIGGRMNVENTVLLAGKVFDKIYLAVNEEIYNVYKGVLKGCTMFSIVTGNGDAHSLLKCLLFLRRREPDVKNLMVCWGDACFVNSMPFLELIGKTEGISSFPALVACSLDKKPYAWFETENLIIKKSHFARDENSPEQGIHDQSLFLLNIDLATQYLSQYKARLHIPDEYDPDGKYEMKLLYSFDFLYENADFEPAHIVMIQGENVLSFNTKEELAYIRNIMKAIGG